MTESLATGFLLHTKPLAKICNNIYAKTNYFLLIYRSSLSSLQSLLKGIWGLGETLSIFMEFPLWVGWGNHEEQGNYFKHWAIKLNLGLSIQKEKFISNKEPIPLSLEKSALSKLNTQWVKVIASGTMTQDTGKSIFVQHAHTVAQTAEKFHIEGMHTSHTDTSYNTMGERAHWFLGNVTGLYTNARSERTLWSKGDQNTSSKIHLKIISKPSIIVTDNGKTLTSTKISRKQWKCSFV